MSSSSGKQKKSKRVTSSSRSSSKVATGWSEWEWTTVDSRWQRYRLNAAGVYEFEYRPSMSGEQQKVPPSTPLPRDLATIPELNTANVLSDRTEGPTMGQVVPPWHILMRGETPSDHDYSLPCEFQMLGCSIKFHNHRYEEWIAHTLSHFFDSGPPLKSVCTFCDDPEAYKQDILDPYRTWRARLLHIGRHHQETGGMSGNRPDYFLLEHLDRCGLTPNQDFESFVDFEIPSNPNISRRIRSCVEVAPENNKSSLDRNSSNGEYRINKGVDDTGSKNNLFHDDMSPILSDSATLERQQEASSTNSYADSFSEDVFSSFVSAAPDLEAQVTDWNDAVFTFADQEPGLGGEAENSIQQHKAFSNAVTSNPPFMPSRAYTSARRPVKYSRSSSASSQTSGVSAGSRSSDGQLSQTSKATSLGPDHYGGIDRLVRFLQGNRLLQSSMRQMFGKFGLDASEAKLRSCLVDFSKDILLEAKTARSNSMIQASKLLRYLARATATSIKASFDDEFSNTDRAVSHRSIDPKHSKQTNKLEIEEVWTEGSSDDEANAGDLGNEEDEEYDVLPTLEADLASSLACQRLLESLQSHIRSDRVKKSLRQIWPISHDQSEPLRIDYGAEWEVPSFLRKYFHNAPKLGDLMTISGGGVDAQAQSCADYLAEKWPAIGLLLLNALEDFLLSAAAEQVERKNGSAEIVVKEDPGFATSSLKSGLKLSVEAVYSVHVQILTAMSWLCSAIRSSKNPGLAFSSTSVSLPRLQQPNLSLVIKLRALVPLNVEDSCWHTIFPHGIIAEGYPITTRSKAVGLEISFANMALASRSLSMVEYDGGLIAHGLTAMLIPVAELQNDDALQWHFENKANQKGHKLSKISHILRLHGSGNWYQELAPEKLVSRRCFLGWTENAVVALGTQGYNLKIDEWSGASKVPGLSTNKSYEFTFGSGFLGFVTAEGTCVVERTAMQSSISSGVSRDIYHVLSAGDEHFVLLWDNVAKLGWYLPQASVVLQITHSYISNRGYKMYDGDTLVIPENTSKFAKMCSDGALEARRALEECFKFTIVKGVSARGFEKECVKDLIEKIWHTLDNIGVNLDNLDPRFQKDGHVAPRYIHGVELKDAANMERSMKVKRVRVDQPWAHLTSDHSIVLLSKNIQPPIVDSSLNLCKAWTTVPSDHNYLAVMGIAVQSFLKRQAEGLAEGLDWLGEQKLIRSHHAKRGAPFRHSQSLRSMKKPICNLELRKLVLLHLHGCFVFGDGSERKCSERALSSDSAELESDLCAATDEQMEQMAQSSLTIPSECSNTSGSQEDCYSEDSNTPSALSSGALMSSPDLESILVTNKASCPEFQEQHSPSVKIRQVVTVLSYESTSTSQSTRDSTKSPEQCSDKPRGRFGKPKSGSSVSGQAFSRLSISSMKSSIQSSSKWKGKEKEV